MFDRMTQLTKDTSPTPLRSATAGPFAAALSCNECLQDHELSQLYKAKRTTHSVLTKSALGRLLSNALSGDHTAIVMLSRLARQKARQLEKASPSYFGSPPFPLRS